MDPKINETDKDTTLEKDQTDALKNNGDNGRGSDEKGGNRTQP